MQSKASQARQILAVVIGNALEWYDFVVFGYMIAIISHLFFAENNEYVALLKTMAVFGVGFFMRPVGAIVLGIYADHKGRKAALQLIMFLMTVSVAMLAFAPTYAAIGIAAPTILMLARLLQGFATGGEFSSSTAYLIEIAPAKRRGLYASLQAAGQGVAGILGSLAGLLVTGLFVKDQIDAWAWRIPFFFGLLIGPVGMYIRRQLEETTPFQLAASKNKEKKLSLRTVLKFHRRSLFATFGLVVCGTMQTYTMSTYFPVYVKTQLGLSLFDSFLALAIGGLVSIAAGLVFAALSDSIGRKPLLMASIIISFLVTYPLFAWMISSPTLGKLIIVQVIFGVITGGWGAYSAALAEQFPTGVRSTGLALAYNFAVALFGGTSPLIVAWLVQVSGSPLTPAFYLMFSLVIGLIATFFLVEHHKDHILH